MDNFTLRRWIIFNRLANGQAITADWRATAEYKCLRKNQSIDFQDEYVADNRDDLLITCNVRSLRAHAADIRSDKRFLSSDIILGNESQLTEDSNVSDFSIDGFHLSCNNRQIDVQVFIDGFHLSCINRQIDVQVFIDGFHLSCNNRQIDVQVFIDGFHLL